MTATQPTTFTQARALWAADWQAMKAGTYTAPLPHTNLIAYVPNEEKSAHMRRLQADGVIPRNHTGARTKAQAARAAMKEE